jgi:hypothetical protein
VGRTVALFPMEVGDLLVKNGVIINSENMDTSSLIDGVFAGLFGSEAFKTDFTNLVESNVEFI